MLVIDSYTYVMLKFEMNYKIYLFYCCLFKIDDVAVLAVRRRVADVIHYTPVPLDVGRQVNIAVDWTRRWDHMQQHSGFCQQLNNVYHCMYCCSLDKLWSDHEVSVYL